MINSDLAQGVRAFLESGDRGFLETLKALDRNDIQGQAVVRYLMQLKHWPFTPDSDFAGILTHLFAEFPERKKLDPTEYQATTFDLIRDTFDYECVVVVPEAKAPIEKKPAKPTRKPKKVTESEEVPDSDIDTKGASDRLKRVIAIQRGG